MRVVELDGPVRGTPAGGQQVALERAPSQGLYGGLVGGDAVRGPVGGGVPDHQQVVVATTGKLREARGEGGEAAESERAGRGRQ